MAGRPVVTRQQLRQISSQLLDIDVETIFVTRQLDGFDDCNYYVKIKNENDYHDQVVVKILNAESTKIKDSVESKILACHFLYQAGIHCSKPIKLTNGNYIDTVTLSSSDEAGNIIHNDHIVYIVEYIEGNLLRHAQLKFSHIVMHQLGQLIATVDNKLLVSLYTYL